MTVLHRSALALALVTTLAWQPAHAQKPQTRQGFWIGFGLGYGSAGASCDGCGSSDRDGGLTGFLKLGGTLSQKVLLGGEINGWVKDRGQGITETLGNISAAIYFYPSPTGGFFLKGGAGLAGYTLSGDGGSIDGTGWGLLAGLGYDVRVGANISLTPVVNFYFGQPGDITSGGQILATGWSQNVLELGLGITFH